MHILPQIFGSDTPENYSERQLDKVHEISIPWKLSELTRMNLAARIDKKLNGTFTSPFGDGYCVGSSTNDRMLYHFSR